MNYITACPACETQFLINTEHLKAYRGKVQCGNCNHVFNAKNRLTQVSDDTQSAEEYGVAENLETKNVSENIVAESDSIDDSNEFDSNEFDSNEHDLNQYDLSQQSVVNYTNTGSAIDSESVSNPILANTAEFQAPTSGPVKSVSATSVDGKPISEKLNIVLGSVPDLSDLTSLELAQANLQSDESTQNSYINNNTPIIILEDDVDIKSIRAPILIEDLTADPKFQLIKPKRNLWLIAINGLLLLAVILQSAYFLRSKIAAAYPQFKPYLVQACERLRCNIDLPKQLDLLSIDDSDMQESENYLDVIDFSSLIINNANHVQAYPNLELTLTDAEDKPVLRKVVKPQEYLQPTTDPTKGIGAHDEERINLAIDVYALSVVGYRVLLTY